MSGADDEITTDPVPTDPELTTAADADWIAELRAEARARKARRSATSADDVNTVDAGQGPDVEETTAAGGAAMDAVRDAVADVDSTGRVPDAPTTPPQTTPDEPPPSPSGSTRRWEPPARIDASTPAADVPVVRHEPEHRRHVDRRVVAVAVVAALVVGFLIARFIGSDGGEEEIDPDVSVVVSVVEEGS